VTVSLPVRPDDRPQEDATPLPVFVDGTGRRLRWVRRAALAVGATCVVSLALLGAALGAGSVEPVTSGLPGADGEAPVIVGTTPSTATPAPARSTRATATRRAVAPVTAATSVPATTAAPTSAPAAAVTGTAPPSAPATDSTGPSTPASTTASAEPTPDEAGGSATPVTPVADPEESR
jgi:hypothetical protein